MIENIFQEYSRVENLLEQHELMVTPAELHGVVCGLLCGGVSGADRSWLQELAALVNNGEALSAEVRGWVVQLFEKTQETFRDQTGLELLLPPDDADLSERLGAMSEFVQAFLAGFAVAQKNLSKASDELQEIIKDLSSISLLDEDYDDSLGDENEDAFYVVYEHVKLGMMLAFEEFGVAGVEQAPTIH
jgi:yecA family protein